MEGTDGVEEDLFDAPGPTSGRGAAKKRGSGGSKGGGSEMQEEAAVKVVNRGKRPKQASLETLSEELEFSEVCPPLQFGIS